MARQYLVIGNGVRKTGEPYSKCAPILTNKEGRQFLGNDLFYYDDIIEVGVKVSLEQSVQMVE